MSKGKPQAGSPAHWGQKAEAFLRKATVLSLLLFIVLQAVNWRDDVEKYYSFSHWLAPAPANTHAPGGGETAFLSYAAKEVLTVSLIVTNRASAPEAALTVNGVTAATFTDPHVTIEVQPGDRLQLEGAPDDGPLHFRIVDTSPGLRTPRQGAEFILQDGKAILEPVTAN